MLYKHKEYDKEAVKAVILEFLPEVDAISTFEKIDYDLEKFFLTEADKFSTEILTELLLRFKKNLEDYFIDLINGYWEFPEAPNTINARKLCKYFFFCCETDEDVWDLLYDYCPVQTACQIYKCYTGECRRYEDDVPVCLEDPDKAERMLEYFRERENKRF